MAERILSEETINTFREYLVLEEKSTATVEKYLRDVRAFHLFVTSVIKNKIRMIGDGDWALFIRSGTVKNRQNTIFCQKVCDLDFMISRKAAAFFCTA